MSNLEEAFNVEDVKKEIKTFKEILKEITEIPNPSLVVTAALEKASMFLDLIHSEVENGEMSPRYMEVSAQLINTIIQTSGFLNQTMQDDFNNKMKKISSDQKDRELDIKEKEVDIKQIYYNKKQIEGGKTQNNIIVTDHKSIMKFLSEKSDNKEKLIEEE